MNNFPLVIKQNTEDSKIWTRDFGFLYTLLIRTYQQLQTHNLWNTTVISYFRNKVIQQSPRQHNAITMENCCFYTNNHCTAFYPSASKCLTNMIKPYHDWEISKRIKTFSLRAEKLRQRAMSKGFLSFSSIQAGIKDKLTNKTEEPDLNSQRIQVPGNGNDWQELRQFTIWMYAYKMKMDIWNFWQIYMQVQKHACELQNFS